MQRVSRQADMQGSQAGGRAGGQAGRQHYASAAAHPVGATADEQLGRLSIAVVRGVVQRRAPGGVTRVQLGAVLQQQLHQRDVARLAQADRQTRGHGSGRQIDRERTVSGPGDR
jgi:hypothetical protein